MSPTPPRIEAGARALIEDALARLSAVRDDLRGAALRHEPELAGLHPRYRESGRNLVHYLALRHHDIRGLQKALGSLGLSSLGRTEAHVLATIEGALHALHRLLDRPWEGTPLEAIVAGFHLGKQLLEEHTAELLGPRPRERFVRIMVTLPSEAGDDYALVRALLERGMDCARINCAHDGPADWARMAAHVRRAAAELGKPCKVLMDLAGPKLRTGALEPGPCAVRVRPRRDARGTVLAPARVWLTPAEAPEPAPAGAAATLPLAAAWLADLPAGVAVRLRDIRGKHREWRLVERAGASAWAEAEETSYVEPGVTLRAGERAAQVGALPARDGVLVLRPGDLLWLTRDATPGRGPTADGSPARIPCTLPAVFGMVRAGESVWFDDGHIGGVVEAASPERLVVRIRHAAAEGSKLAGDKGINLPESALTISGLTDADREALPHAAALADLVGLSFANDPEDVRALHDELARHGSSAGVVLKIETRRGFEHLPHLLLAAMKAHPLGVMIARGDLAVECGFERLAEVQEEMLCVCEAAQVPVVWATQVLENMAKSGQPTRAEVTDAAMSVRAECVMLNKGPYILDTVRTLDDVIHRMQAHQSKRTPKLRALHLAELLDRRC